MVKREMVYDRLLGLFEVDMVKEHGKKGNPSPTQTEKFKQKRFKKVGNEEYEYPLGKKTIGFRLPVDFQNALFSLPPEERIPFLRRIVSMGLLVEYKDLVSAVRAEIEKEKD